MAKESVPEPKENYSREDDKISSEEFQNLEKKESKFNPLKKALNALGKKKEKGEAGKEAPKMDENVLIHEFYQLNEKFDNLLTKVERNAGKIELEDQNRSVLSNRISEVLSQVGELRSVIVTKERYFNQVESKVEKLFDQVNMLRPEETEKKINDLRLKINGLEASLEKSEATVTNMQDTVNKLNEKMGEVKSFKNVADYMKNIQEMENNITKTKDFIEKKSARVELFAQDFQDKLESVDRLSEQLKAMEQSLNQLDRRKDEIQQKMGEAASQEDLKKLSKTVEVLKKDIYKGYMKQFSELAGKEQAQAPKKGLFSRIVRKKEDELPEVAPPQADDDGGWLESFMQRSLKLNRDAKQVKEMLTGAGYDEETAQSLIKKYDIR